VEGRDLDASQRKEFNAWLESLENSIAEWARKKSRELYSELENEYESMTSDEAIQEWIDSMGYEFTRDGEKID
jgi:arsenate reductase-like glutaredoxin family protein